MILALVVLAALCLAQMAASHVERGRWEAERTRLVNALVADTPQEFVARQLAAEPGRPARTPKAAEDKRPRQPLGL